MGFAHKRIYQAQPWRQVAFCLMVLTTGAIAFQPTSRVQQPTTVRRMAAVDPNDLANIAAAIHHHSDVSSWDAILSTLYSTTAEVLKPAHGHSQPLFGPPDPWLTGPPHSIPPPNLKALDLPPATPTDQLPEVAQAAIQKGLKVVDASKWQAGGGSTLPGFKPTGGILPQHANVPEANMESFTAQVFGSARFLNVLEKIPMAAFVYVLVDFFLLRPDVDLYKEDIEEEPLEVAAETLAVTGVRLGVLFLIGFVTLVIFG